MTARFKSRARIVCVVAFVAVAAFLTSVRLRSATIGIDDANIFLVYARNFSAGEGFVFNPGGERVEGFTSLLWALVVSAATLIAANPEHVLLALNVVLVALTLMRCLRELSGAWAAAFVAALLSDLSYVAWHTITLMEAALWSALITTAVLISSSERAGRNDALRLSVVGALLVLTRPEALLWVPILVGLFYVGRTRETTRAEAVRLILPAVVAFVLTAGTLTIFRLVYFGFPLPNTYYAKVSPSITHTLSEGSAYLQSYATSPMGFIVVLAIFVSTLHLVTTGFRDTKTFTLTAAAATGLAVPVLTGGDHFQGFRFYQPLYPVLLLTLMNCVRRVIPQYVPFRIESVVDSRLKLVATAVGLGICVVWQAVEWISLDRSALLGREFDIAIAGRQVGNQANAVFGTLQPLPDIATITVGGLKYTYRGPVTDLMGLNDTRMAHNGGARIGIRSHAAFEIRTFYDMRPAVVLPLVQYHDSLPEVGHRDLFADGALKGLLGQPQFHSRYQLAEVRKLGANGGKFVAWYERTFLTRLMERSDLQVAIADRDYR